MKKKFNFVKIEENLIMTTRQKYKEIIDSYTGDKERILVSFKDIEILIKNIYNAMNFNKYSYSFLTQIASHLEESKNYWSQIHNDYEKITIKSKASFYHKVLTRLNMNPVMFISEYSIYPPIYAEDKKDNKKYTKLENNINKLSIKYEIDKLHYDILQNSIKEIDLKDKFVVENIFSLFGLLVMMTVVFTESPRFEFDTEQYSEKINDNYEIDQVLNTEIDNQDPTDLDIDNVD